MTLWVNDMDKKEALRRAVKNISDAQRAIRSAENRTGVKDEEMRNLKGKLEYAQYVFRLIEKEE